MDKTLLRRYIRERKRQYTREQLDRQSEELLSALERHPKFVESGTILLYHSLPDEVRTQQFIERWSKTKAIVLPAVKGDELELRLYTGEHDLQQGAFGISEPSGEVFTRYADIGLAVIPGMAFDVEGNRLGRGKGYYDRLLPHIGAHKIGLCFRFQFLEHVPHAPHDIRVDEVIHG